jgi:hypothetical protein
MFNRLNDRFETLVDRYCALSLWKVQLPVALAIAGTSLCVVLRFPPH